ncbi:MAG: HEAT repeat domain-containing protein [Myxococcales bacterium]
MGLLDMLGMGGPEAKVRRLQKKASEKFGPKENRQGAIEELGGLKTEAAIEALLTRYTFRVDPGITDDDEKARVLALITQAGEVALAPVKRFISTRDEISWPLRALEGLLPEAEVVKFLVEVARKIGGEYSRVPEKKVLLLHALSGHKSAEIAPAILPFLEDMDDEVQIAAAEVIAKQQDPLGREPLIRHFLQAHEGSNARVREALAGLLADSGWDVKGYTPKVEAALPAGYKLDSKGKVSRK